MSKTNLKELGGKIFEAKKDDSGKKKFPVVIISQGMGNLVDKNYYSKEAILSGPEIYEGKKAYYDHPTESQEKEQPGRSVKEICGHYENCRVEEDENGLAILKADLVPIESKQDVIGLIEHAIEYKKKYPNKEFIGISINGDGDGQRLDYEDFIKQAEPNDFEMKKISEIEGQPINLITKFTDAISADIVTEAGARGKILKENKKRKGQRMLEAMKKFLLGAEKNDQKLMEEAAKDIMSDEKKEDEKKEDEGKKKAEGLAKALLACKKEMKKEEEESEEEYEARCMQSALKKHEEEMKKEDEVVDKKDDDKGDDEEEKKEDEKKEDDGGEKKDDAAADDEDHADKAQDVALIKKMMKQMDEMKKEIEGLKKEKKESDDEAKKHHEESAKAKSELAGKDRALLIVKELEASRLPYTIREQVKPLLEKARSKEEMKKIIESAREAFNSGVESVLMRGTETGFVEITTSEQPSNNDKYFL